MVRAAARTRCPSLPEPGAPCRPVNRRRSVGQTVTMFRVAGLVASGVLATVLLVGCGSSGSASTTTLAPEPTLAGAAAIRGVDPCKLLTRAEIAAVVDRPVGAPEQRITSSTATCTWSITGRGPSSEGVAVQVVPVSVFDSTLAAGEGSQSTLPLTARTTIKRVPGVGDAAYAVSLDEQSSTFGQGGDLLAVRVGDRSLFVSTDLRGLGSLGSLLASRELAKKAAPRL